MIYKIYCIIDINGLKYVGSTNRLLKYRLTQHKYHKKHNEKCVSKLLDLDNCEIILLCECVECDRNKIEQYFIDNIKCVNKNNALHNRKQYDKQYYENNKQRKNNFHKLWIKNNEEINKQYQKEYHLFNTKKVCNGCYDFINMLNQY